MDVIVESAQRMRVSHSNLLNLVILSIIAVASIGAMLWLWQTEPLFAGLAGIFLIAALIGIATINSLNIVLDKTGQCSFTIASIIKKETASFGIKDVDKVQFEVFRSTRVRTPGGKQVSFRRRRMSVSYTIALLLRDGRVLSYEYAPSATLLQEKEFEKAKKIADFIGVPLEQVKPPSIEDIAKVFQSGGQI